jgi:nucleoside-diphosphate-sugar epimerase
MESKRILITGAAGGVGAPLVELLDMHDLFLVDNFSSGSIRNLNRLGLGNNVHSTDLLSLPEVDKLFAEFNPEIVIHLAARTSLPECEIDSASAIRQNVEVTSNLLNVSRNYKIDQFIFASTSAVYEMNKALPFRESDLVNPKLIYPLTKLMSEQICKSYAENYGIPITVLRLFNIFGPYQNFHRKSPPLINYLALCYLRGEQPQLHSNGTQKRDYISVFDVCRAFEKVVESSQELSGFNLFNVCSNQTLSVLEIDNIAREVFNSKKVATYRESGEYWDGYKGLFDRFYPLSKDVVQREVTKHSRGDNSAILDALGWSPSNLQEALEEVFSIIKNDFGNESI